MSNKISIIHVSNNVRWYYKNGKHYISKINEFVSVKNLNKLIRIYCDKNGCYFINTDFNSSESNGYYRYIFLKNPVKEEQTKLTTSSEEKIFYTFQENDVIVKLATQSQILGYLMKELFNIDLDNLV